MYFFFSNLILVSWWGGLDLEILSQAFPLHCANMAMGILDIFFSCLCTDGVQISGFEWESITQRVQWRVAASKSAPRQETRSSLMKTFAELQEKVENAKDMVDLEMIDKKLGELQAETEDEGFWTRSQSSIMEVMSQMKSLKADKEQLRNLENMAEDVEIGLEMLAEEEQDEGSDETFLEGVVGTIEDLKKGVRKWELEKFLSGPFDDHAAYVTIQAGAGGTEAQDWAEILERMYSRWAQEKEFKVSVLNRLSGEVAGIKSVEMEVEGKLAYGYLASENGTHRLVRISPFDSSKSRHTSFAAVEVMPVLGESAKEVEINDSDLEITTMRSGGKGGQNVNKVESGVRITHLPTQISVKCTEDRTQLRNKAIALERLKAKLLVIAQQQEASRIAEIRGDQVKAEWGQQIRNYVLHPYQMVKDLRTGFETSSADSVLNGDLDDFMEKYLRYKGEQQFQEKNQA